MSPAFSKKMDKHLQKKVKDGEYPIKTHISGNPIMHCLTVGLSSENYIARWFHHCVNIIERADTHLDDVAYHHNCMCYTFICLAAQ